MEDGGSSADHDEPVMSARYCSDSSAVRSYSENLDTSSLENLSEKISEAREREAADADDVRRDDDTPSSEVDAEPCIPVSHGEREAQAIATAQSETVGVSL